MSVRQLRVEGLPNLVDDDRKVLRKLDRLSGEASTVESVLDLDPQQFGQTEGVGAVYVRRLQDLQKRLQLLFPELEGWSAPESIDGVAFEDAMLAEYTLNELDLSRGERKFLAKLREGAGTASLDRILAIDAAEYAKQRGVGEFKLDVLRGLQAQVVKALAAQGSGASPTCWTRRPIVHAAPLDLEVQDLERILIEDFEEYLHRLDETLSTIVLARWGYHQPRRILRHLAEELGMTRERVRQLEVEAHTPLPWCSRLHPDVLWHNLQRLAGRDLGQALPFLCESFTKPKVLYEFLETCCLRPIAAHPERLWLAPEEKIDLTLLENFLAATPAPLDAEDYESELCGGQGMGPHQARAFVERLREAADLVPTKRGLEPRGLRQTVAVAHVLAGEPAGLPFGDIARCVNARQLTERAIREDRLSVAIGANSWLHLNGSGSYRHNEYLELTEEQVRGALALTRAHMESRDGRSRNLQMLHSELGGRLGLGYFKLRHVLSQFGSEAGLYFTGKSRVDTVSLDERHDGVCLRDGILRLLQDSDGPLTLPEIAEKLRSKSIGLAALNLGELRTSGAAVRVDRQLYTTAERAFAGLDLDAIGDAIAAVLSEAKRPVEADYLSQVLNRRMERAFSRYYYLSLARQLSRSYGWNIRGTLVAWNPITFPNLRILARTVLTTGTEQEEGVRILHSAVAMTMQTARCLWQRHQGSEDGDSRVRRLT